MAQCVDHSSYSQGEGHMDHEDACKVLRISYHVSCSTAKKDKGKRADKFSSVASQHFLVHAHGSPYLSWYLPPHTFLDRFQEQSLMIEVVRLGICNSAY